MKRQPDEFAKRVVELLDGDAWTLADEILDQYPVDEYGAAANGPRTGIHAELERFALRLRQEEAVEVKGSTLSRYRNVALAWPGGTRVQAASFAVHLRMRGPDRFDEMKRRVAQAKRERVMLTVDTLRRFRADENPARPKQFDERMRAAIAGAVRRELLGGIITKRPDWWMADAVSDQSRAVAVRELIALAERIAAGSAR